MYVLPGVTGIPNGLGVAIEVISPDDRSPKRLYAHQSSGEAAMYVAWGRDPKLLFYNTMDATGRLSFWSVPAAGGTSRLLLRDDPAHRLGRFNFATDGRRLFFTLAADESDVYVAELKP